MSSKTLFSGEKPEIAIITVRKNKTTFIEIATHKTKMKTRFAGFARSKNELNKANQAWPIELKNPSHFMYQEHVTQSKSDL